MKKLILSIIIILFSKSFCSNSSNEQFFKNIKESEYSFILLVKDENDENNLAKFPLNKLKKCNFPTGALRANTNIDFIEVTEEINVEINELIANKKCMELQIFCIDSTNNPTNKYRTCGFELPNKNKLCYVFSFDKEIKEIKGFILSNYETEQLLLRVKENENDLETDLPEPPPNIDIAPLKPASWWRNRLEQIGVCILLKYLKIRRYFIDKYEKLQNTLHVK